MKFVLDVSCDVELMHSDQSGWDSNNKDAFQVTDLGDVLKIRQKGGGGGTTVITGDRTYISTGGRSVVIGDVQGSMIIGGSGGGVWVNGKRIDAQDNSPIPEIPRLIVYVPYGADVEIKTSGSANIDGSAKIGHLSLRTSGSTNVDADVHTAEIKTSGSSDISLKLRGGKVDSSFSGSTKFSLR